MYRGQPCPQMSLSMSDSLDYRLFYRRHLPHYQAAEGIFFITYRLAFSLPQKVLWEFYNNICKEKEAEDKQRKEELIKPYRERYEELCKELEGAENQREEKENKLKEIEKQEEKLRKLKQEYENLE